MKIETEYPTASTPRPCSAECGADIAPGERYVVVTITSNTGAAGLRRYCRRCWPLRAYTLGGALGAADLLDETACAGERPADGA